MNITLHDAKKEVPENTGWKSKQFICYMEMGYWLQLNSYNNGWNCPVSYTTGEINTENEIEGVLLWGELPKDIPCDECPLCEKETE